MNLKMRSHGGIYLAIYCKYAINDNRAVAAAMHFLISAVGTEEGKEIDGARNGISP